jgi:hypothetical protein
MPIHDGIDIQGREHGRKTRTFGELLIDCEEDRALRAVLVGMLREAEPVTDRRPSRSATHAHTRC